MMSVWATLAPLILGGALVPMQMVITILLLRSAGGVRTTLAWIAGMATVRLVQGGLFGPVLASEPPSDGSSSSGPGTVLSTLLLVLALVLYATALRRLLIEDDPDAPPPKWLKLADSMTAWRAFLFGLAMVVISAKFWIFTLGAVGAIADEHLGVATSVGLFLLFVALTESPHLVAVGTAVVSPERSAGMLDSASTWLQAHNRQMVILFATVFGTWFLLKALNGLGVI